MFIRHSHWLTIPSSLAPRQNDVICLNLHSRFGLFLSERVLCQSSFAQRDYSQCTYSQTTANGIAGVINELNHSYTITYAAHVSHAGIEIRSDHIGSFRNSTDTVALGGCPHWNQQRHGCQKESFFHVSKLLIGETKNDFDCEYIMLNLLIYRLYDMWHRMTSRYIGKRFWAVQKGLFHQC